MAKDLDSLQDPSWQQMIEILASTPESPQRQRATAFLRDLQRMAFLKLKEAMEDPEEETSWEEHWLLIRIDIPGGSWPDRPSEAPVLDENAPLAGGMLAVLTAGATGVEEDGRMYPAPPPPLAEVLTQIATDERRQFFDAWLQPASYGDDDAKTGSIIARSSDRQTFRAGLGFQINPVVLNPQAREVHCDIYVGLPWEGNASPETWTEGEREALWASIFEALNALREASSGRSLPEKISRRVPVQPPPRKAFESFDVLLIAPGQKSLAEKLSARGLRETALALLPLNRLSPTRQGPVLLIADGRGNLQPSAAMEVLLVMCYPDAEAKRRELRVAIEDASISAALAGVDIGSIEEVLDQRPFLVDLSSRAAENRYGGIFAGDLLLFLLNAAEHDPENASVLRSLHVIQRDMRDGSEGGRRRTSRSTLLALWGRFKPVAHLWAALRIWNRDLKKDPGFALMNEHDDEGAGLLNFLALAEALRTKAEGYVVRGQKGPILDPDETWSAPSILRLAPVKFQVPDLTDWAKEELARYRSKPQPPSPLHRKGAAVK